MSRLWRFLAGRRLALALTEHDAAARELSAALEGLRLAGVARRGGHLRQVGRG